MKKIFIIIILYFCFFCTDIYAKNACDDAEFQCITCTYQLGDEVTYEVKANGNGGATVNRTIKKHEENDKITYAYDDPDKNPIAASNFIIDSKKLVCPKEIYYQIYHTNLDRTGRISKYLSFSKFSDSNNTEKLLKETDNKKNFAKSNSTGKSCTYKGQIVRGSGTAPVITITRSGKELLYEVGNGYTTSGVTVSYKDFPEKKKGTCPKLSIKCVNFNNTKTCTISKDEGGVSGDKSKNGEDLIDNSVEMDKIVSGKTTCKALFSGQFGILLGKAFSLIRFLVPILIIGLGVLDYAKAMLVQNQDEVNKTTKKMAKRLMIGVVIFLLPTIIEVVLGLAGYGINDGHCFDWLK